jgi:hypothetical protein
LSNCRTSPKFFCDALTCRSMPSWWHAAASSHLFVQVLHPGLNWAGKVWLEFLLRDILPWPRLFGGRFGCLNIVSVPRCLR